MGLSRSNIRGISVPIFFFPSSNAIFLKGVPGLCMMQRGSSIIAEPDKFGCYVVVDPKSSASLASALRYWGCVIQAGAQVSGALAFGDAAGLREKVDKSFSPLPYTFIPHLSVDTRLEWNHIMQDACSEDARKLLAVTSHGTRIHPVKFDPANKTVTLLMPGFDKSEIKLYQVCITNFTLQH